MFDSVFGVSLCGGRNFMGVSCPSNVDTFPSSGGVFSDSCNCATPYAFSQFREERLLAPVCLYWTTQLSVDNFHEI